MTDTAWGMIRETSVSHHKAWILLLTSSKRNGFNGLAVDLKEEAHNSVNWIDL